MNTDEHRFILGKKTKKEILKDVENRFIQLVVGALFFVTTMILIVILSIKSLSVGNFEKVIWVVVLSLLAISIVFISLGLRCVFCDKIKWRDFGGNKYLSYRKRTYKCFNCNLSDNQIKEIVDMLKRGVEINKETIARFNKRNL